MRLQFLKRVYLTPFVRLNFYTQGVSISFGHTRIGWLTFGRHAIWQTVDSPDDSDNARVATSLADCSCQTSRATVKMLQFEIFRQR